MTASYDSEETFQPAAGQTDRVRLLVDPVARLDEACPLVVKSGENRRVA